MTPVFSRRFTLRSLFVAGLFPRFSATSDTPTQAVLVRKGEGEHLKIGGAIFDFKLNKNQTGGKLAFAEAVISVGALGAPPHLHRTFDEICYVLEGTVQVWVEGEVVTLHSGDVHLRPKGKMHTFWNAGTIPAKCLEISMPGGHEDYLRDLSQLLAKGTRPQPEDFAALAQKHDIVYFWDKLPEIIKKYQVQL